MAKLPSAYPIVQPMKSYVSVSFHEMILRGLSRALYFDTAKGFGDWTVVISRMRTIFLRRAHKKNISAFNAIVEKIKYVSDFMVSCITHAYRNHRELSCGHFTDDNQKRLCGSATEVPVFSAKISRSLRLVVGNRFLINLGYHSRPLVVSNR